MALVVANLTSGGTGTGATSFTTASISPGANNLILLSTHARHAAGTPVQPTASGCSLTWVVIASVTYQSGSGNVKRFTMFRALGSAPTTGAVTISYGSDTESHASWVIDQISNNIDISGANGANAIIQPTSNTDQNADTAFSITLATFSGTGNITYGGFSDENNTGITKGASFTLAGQGASAGGNTLTQYALSNQTTVNVTDSPGTAFGGVALEIKAQTSNFMHFFPLGR